MANLTYRQLEEKREAALQSLREDLRSLEAQVKQLRGENELLMDALAGDCLARDVAARYDLTDDVLHAWLTATDTEHDRIADALLALTEVAHV